MTSIQSRTGAELLELITGVYRDALRDPGFEADGDFFEAGGDSLSAFQITAGIQAATGVEVPVALVFAYPTPADLTAVVEEEA
jgi:acyl carrier protein